MNKTLLPFFASMLMALPAQAEFLRCISRDQPLGRGYEVRVRNGSSLELFLRERKLVPAEAARKVSVPTAGGGARTDYLSAHLHLVVSSKQTGDYQYYSMLSIRGGTGPIPLYCE